MQCQTFVHERNCPPDESASVVTEMLRKRFGVRNSRARLLMLPSAFRRGQKTPNAQRRIQTPAFCIGRWMLDYWTFGVFWRHIPVAPPGLISTRPVIVETKQPAKSKTAA